MSLFIPSVSLSHPNPKKKAKMKTPYHKNKGKVHPSPSSSSSNSSSASTNAKDALSVLNLLPVAILALASILTVEDREVLAYLVTRSLNTSNPVLIIEDNKKKCKKSSSANPNSNYSTKNKKSQPIFDCGCFDCYTSYWFRWDSSPNRELINQAIEAFEEHLTNGETSSSSSLMKNNRGGKKRDKLSRRTAKLEKPEPLPPPPPSPPPASQEPQSPVVAELAVVVPEAEVAALVVSEYSEEKHHHQKAEDLDGKVTTAVQFVPSNNHKGMARKLLPDFIGLFNSRIWNLWSPNI